MEIIKRQNFSSPPALEIWPLTNSGAASDERFYQKITFFEMNKSPVSFTELIVDHDQNIWVALSSMVQKYKVRNTNLQNMIYKYRNWLGGTHGSRDNSWADNRALCSKYWEVTVFESACK